MKNSGKSHIPFIPYLKREPEIIVPENESLEYGTNSSFSEQQDHAEQKREKKGSGDLSPCASACYWQVKPIKKGKP